MQLRELCPSSSLDSSSLQCFHFPLNSKQLAQTQTPSLGSCPGTAGSSAELGGVFWAAASPRSPALRREVRAAEGKIQVDSGGFRRIPGVPPRGDPADSRRDPALGRTRCWAGGSRPASPPEHLPVPGVTLQPRLSGTPCPGTAHGGRLGLVHP